MTTTIVASSLRFGFAVEDIRAAFEKDNHRLIGVEEVNFYVSTDRTVVQYGAIAQRAREFMMADPVVNTAYLTAIRDAIRGEMSNSREQSLELLASRAKEAAIQAKKSGVHRDEIDQIICLALDELVQEGLI